MTQTEVDQFRGTFRAEYGRALAIAAAGKDPGSELERGSAKALLLAARGELEQAVALLTANRE
jgi:hypothetical protein